MYYKTLTSW